jgi:hypothetical protein
LDSLSVVILMQTPHLPKYRPRHLLGKLRP